MRIRLAVGMTDARYLEVFIRFLESKHSEKFDIATFTRPDGLRDYLKEADGSEVLLLEDSFDISAEELKKFSYARISEDIQGVQDGIRFIGKFTKPEMIYKEILALYLNTGKAGSGEEENGNCSLLLVQSASGGTGVSTVAAAFARYYAAQGEKVLYLNLEQVSSTDEFFRAEGNYTFKDVIYGLKSNPGSIGIKAESCIRISPEGVEFFAPCTKAVYMTELTHEERQTLIRVLKAGKYDRIVVDMDFELNIEELKYFHLANDVLFVTDGSSTAGRKLLQALEALRTLAVSSKLPFETKLKLIYNRTGSGNRVGSQAAVDVPVIAKIPAFSGMTSAEILRSMLSNDAVFNKI